MPKLLWFCILLDSVYCIYSCIIVVGYCKYHYCPSYFVCKYDFCKKAFCRSI